MSDYTNIGSFVEYKNLAYSTFDNAEHIIYDATKAEYYYLKANDLLRVSSAGDFISLYPGADSERVINAINALK